MGEGGHPTLVCSYHTLGRASFEERVAAAAGAGFDGIGLSISAYRALTAEGWSDDELLEVLAAQDQQILEVEVVRGWGSSGDERARADAFADIAFHLADVFGASYLQAIGPCPGTVADVGRAFGELCARAGDHGMDVGLEFLPVISNIPDLATATTIVSIADRPNAGVCIDSWHFIRGGADWETLAALPGQLVKAVQINDGTLEPEDGDYLADCLHNRRLPGAGDFDLKRFVRALDAIGVSAPVSVEVISDELDRLPAEDAAAQAAEATRSLMRAALWSSSEG